MNNKDNTDSGLLHRIDERTTLLIGKFGEMKEEIQDIRDHMNKKYVSQDEFIPVKNVVYGMVGTLLLSVFGAVIALVINRG